MTRRTRRVQMYPAGSPKEGQWVIAWQNEYMPCPSFFYFNKEEAEEAFNNFIAEGYKKYKFVKEAMQ